VADDRSNSVVISGDQSQRLRLRALIAHLDTPLKRTGNTRVGYLRFANAEKIAPKLKEQITGIAQATARGKWQLTWRNRSNPCSATLKAGQFTVHDVPLRKNAMGTALVTPFQVPLNPNPE
jgi:type II secretory pathway component GspD/PulD (secretin)